MVTERMWDDEMRRDGLGWSELKASVFVLLWFSFLVVVGIIIGVNI